MTITKIKDHIVSRRIRKINEEEISNSQNENDGMESFRLQMSPEQLNQQKTEKINSEKCSDDESGCGSRNEYDADDEDGFDKCSGCLVDISIDYPTDEQQTAQDR